eukprot:jgi/Botrbrau1/16681/Bobra.0068s0096.3
MDPEELVLSDVHIENCPPGRQLWTTDFEVFEGPLFGATVPGTGPAVDEDGDLIVTRKPSAGLPGHRISICHRLSTPLQDVGLQVWQGALLMADYIMDNPLQFQDAVVLELGCGTGLAGTVASLFARRVYLTDVETGVLRLCQANVRNNQQRGGGSDVRVRRLDWDPPWPWAGHHEQHADSRCGSRLTDDFDWTPADWKISLLAPTC